MPHDDNKPNTALVLVAISLAVAVVALLWPEPAPKFDPNGMVTVLHEKAHASAEVKP